MSIIRLFLVVLVIVGACSSPALAERRVALVIGNGLYARNAVLTNPVNDAKRIAEALKRLHFETLVGIDLNQRDFRQFVGKFARLTRKADVALLFYAGHGVQVGAENYLVPIDAEASEELDAKLQFLALRSLQEAMSPVGTRIFILDACRDNPFGRALTARSATPSRSMTRGGSGDGGVLPGLAQIDARESSGTFIAFATAPGSVANDGDGGNSPFTSALLHNIEKPAVTISDMMIEVRNEVRSATGNQQTPWDSSSLHAPFRFNPLQESAASGAPSGGPGAGSVAQPTPQQTAPVPVAPPGEGVEIALWQSIQSSQSVDEYEEYLRQFPQGRFARIAHLRIARLSAAAPGGGVGGAHQPSAADNVGTEAAGEQPVDGSIVMQRRVGTELEGMKYASPPVTAVGECEDACRRDRRCRAIEFYIDNATCGLFETVPPRQARKGVVTSLKSGDAAPRDVRLRRLRQSSVAGEGYDTTSEDSYDDCALRCLHDGRCRMMEFYVPKSKCNLFTHTRVLKEEDDDAQVGVKE